MRTRTHPRIVQDPAELAHRLAEREAEIAELRAELVRERTRRQERELEWFEYNRAVAELDLNHVRAALGFEVDPNDLPDRQRSRLAAEQTTEEAGDSEPASEEEREAARRVERARSIQTTLRTLFLVEGLRGVDLLEVGALGDGWIGPVVFRTLDDRGRLTGGLFANRLRLEASFSARTVTVVLEEGKDSRGGRAIPFAEGARRIVLPFVDPEPWMEAIPELFPKEFLERPSDDGLWSMRAVRQELNRLLLLETSVGWYRLRALEGVLEDELVRVQLDEFDESGRLLRRIFADRMQLSVGDPGVVLTLHEGAFVRGNEKTAFPGGSYRIYMPRAPEEEWREAKLPGLFELEGDAGHEPAGEGEEAASADGRTRAG